MPSMLRLMSIILALVFLLPSPAQAQSDAGTDAVIAPIRQLFDAMRAGDSTAVRAVFTADASMGTVRSASGGTGAVQWGSLDGFVNAVGQPHEAVWDERIWDVEVRINGPMATAWTPYAFYLGDRLSHCGVNAFQLVRKAEGWKIFHIADTRQQEGCEIPPDVQK